MVISCCKTVFCVGSSKTVESSIFFFHFLRLTTYALGIKSFYEVFPYKHTQLRNMTFCVSAIPFKRSSNKNGGFDSIYNSIEKRPKLPPVFSVTSHLNERFWLIVRLLFKLFRNMFWFGFDEDVFIWVWTGAKCCHIRKFKDLKN